ncbi:transposase [Nonomuraea sp. B19D2]|uniref:transposase n=1 Tax=Nonomuraea sp. B19D2 TaxID=3159561 RepID=UPI0032DBDF75
MLSRFRDDAYACLSARADALFELTDALLCEPGPVHSPVNLTLSPEYRRGHGALYSGLNHGRIDVEQLREVLAGWADRAGSGCVPVVALGCALLSRAGCRGFDHPGAPATAGPTPSQLPASMVGAVQGRPFRTRRCRFRTGGFSGSVR